MKITWRDDDVLCFKGSIDRLREVDDLFQAAEVEHTVAIIASALTPELASLIRERRMVPQLHCWDHDDLSVDVNAVAQLPDALAKIEDMTGTRPTILFPPWNRVSLMLANAATGLGLRLSAAKVSLNQFIRFKGKVGEEAINFHYWADEDLVQLPEALRFAPEARVIRA